MKGLQKLPQKGPAFLSGLGQVQLLRVLDQGGQFGTGLGGFFSQESTLFLQSLQGMGLDFEMGRMIFEGIHHDGDTTCLAHQGLVGQVSQGGASVDLGVGIRGEVRHGLDNSLNPMILGNDSLVIRVYRSPLCQHGQVL